MASHDISILSQSLGGLGAGHGKRDTTRGLRFFLDLNIVCSDFFSSSLQPHSDAAGSDNVIRGSDQW